MKQYMILVCLAVSILLGFTACKYENRTEIVHWINGTSYDMDVQIFTASSVWQFELMQGETAQIYENTYTYREGGPVVKTIEPLYITPIKEFVCDKGHMDSVKIYDRNTGELIFEQFNDLDTHHILNWDFLYKIIYQDKTRIYTFTFIDQLLPLSLQQCPCEKDQEPIIINDARGYISYSYEYNIHKISYEDAKYLFYSAERYKEGYITFSGTAYESKTLEINDDDTKYYCIEDVSIQYKSN